MVDQKTCLQSPKANPCSPNPAKCSNPPSLPPDPRAFVPPWEPLPTKNVLQPPFFRGFFYVTKYSLFLYVHTLAKSDATFLNVLLPQSKMRWTRPNGALLLIKNSETQQKREGPVIMYSR